MYVYACLSAPSSFSLVVVIYHNRVTARPVTVPVNVSVRSIPRIGYSRFGSWHASMELIVGAVAVAAVVAAAGIPVGFPCLASYLRLEMFDFAAAAGRHTWTLAAVAAIADLVGDIEIAFDSNMSGLTSALTLVEGHSSRTVLHSVD